MGSPADYPESLRVGATNSLDAAAGFSSRGPSAFGVVKPDISAPGVNVRSSVPGNGYRSLSGTSMAAPHAAGAVALLWAARPDLIGDLPATMALLRGTALNRSEATCGGDSDGDPNNVYGDGRLDALAMVAETANSFRRGTDCVADGRFNISDSIVLLGHLWQGGEVPDCRDACDTNDDQRSDPHAPVPLHGRAGTRGAVPGLRERPHHRPAGLHPGAGV